MKALFRLSRLSAKEYEYLHDGLASTARGKAFLAAYLENNRPDDIKSLAVYLERMETRLTELGSVLQPERISGILRQIAIDLSSPPQPGADDQKTPNEEAGMLDAMRANIDNAVAELERLADAMANLTYALDVQAETDTEASAH